MSIPMSLSDIRTEVKNFIQETGTSLDAIIDAEINKEYERVAQATDWPELRGHLNEVITLTAGNAYLVLPGDAAHIISGSNKVTDFTFINKAHQHLVRDRIADIDTSGDPLFYTDFGLRATRQPLSVADTVEVVSDNAGDTDPAESIRVVGLQNTLELQRTETIVPNGTTPVAGTITYRQGWSVENLSTTDTFTGTITVRETTSDEVLAQFPPGETYPRYYVILLENPPLTADALTVVYKKRVKKLINVDDYPVIPVGKYLVEATVKKMRQYDKKYSQAAVHERGARDLLSADLSERRLQRSAVRKSRVDVRGRGFFRGYK